MIRIRSHIVRTRTRRSLKVTESCILCAAAFGNLPAVVPADQISVAGTPFVEAKIVGLDQGKLQFRSSDGGLRTAWLDEIDLMQVDRGGHFADFNQAERLQNDSKGNEALIRYRRALRLSEDFWSDLIEARILMVTDREGLIDQATTSFLRVLRGRGTGPAAAARLLPRRIPSQRSGAVVEALQQLDSVLARDPGDANVGLVSVLRFEILHRVGDDRAEVEARRTADWSVPAAQRFERVFAIKLTALTRLLSQRVTRRDLEALDQSIKDCPESMLPNFLLLKGRALLETAENREEIIRASWPFWRIVIHAPGDAHAPDALCGAAEALEKLGMADRAMELWKEALAHKAIVESTKKQALTAIDRLEKNRPSQP